MQRAHKRKIKVLVVDAAMMFAAVQMTVCMHGKQRYSGNRKDKYKSQYPDVTAIQYF